MQGNQNEMTSLNKIEEKKSLRERFNAGAKKLGIAALSGLVSAVGYVAQGSKWVGKKFIGQSALADLKKDRGILRKAKGVFKVFSRLLLIAGAVTAGVLLGPVSVVAAIAVPFITSGVGFTALHYREKKRMRTSVEDDHVTSRKQKDAQYAQDHKNSLNERKKKYTKDLEKENSTGRTWTRRLSGAAAVGFIIGGIMFPPLLIAAAVFGTVSAVMYAKKNRKKAQLDQVESAIKIKDEQSKQPVQQPQQQVQQSQQTQNSQNTELNDKEKVPYEKYKISDETCKEIEALIKSIQDPEALKEIKQWLKANAKKSQNQQKQL